MKFNISYIANKLLNTRLFGKTSDGTDKEVKVAGDGTLITQVSDKNATEEGSIKTTLVESLIMLPVDIQGRDSKTVQTHNAVSVEGDGSSVAGYIKTEGYNEIAVSLVNEGEYSSNVVLCWSNDGVSVHAWDTAIGQGTSQRRVGITQVKAPYVRVQVDNKDTQPRTISAWVYLKA